MASVVFWTTERVEELKRLRDENKTYMECAGEMGRTKGSIAEKCRELGLGKVRGKERFRLDGQRQRALAVCQRMIREGKYPTGGGVRKILKGSASETFAAFILDFAAKGLIPPKPEKRYQSPRNARPRLNTRRTTDHRAIEDRPNWQELTSSERAAKWRRQVIRIEKRTRKWADQIVRGWDEAEAEEMARLESVA